MSPGDMLAAIGHTTEHVRCFDGERNELMQGLAQRHAADMAARRKQDHRGFSARFQAIQHALHISAAEICAESWDRQKDDSLDKIATEMYDCWRQSPGHWKIATTPAQFYGASMAQGKNGIWYACVIAGGFLS